MKHTKNLIKNIIASTLIIAMTIPSVFAQEGVGFQQDRELQYQVKKDGEFKRGIASQEWRKDLEEHQEQMRKFPQLAKAQAIFVSEGSKRIQEKNIDTSTIAALYRTNQWFRNQRDEGYEPSSSQIYRFFNDRRDDLRKAQAHVDSPENFSRGLQPYTQDIINFTDVVGPAAGGYGAAAMLVSRGFGLANLKLNGADAREKDLELTHGAYKNSKNVPGILNQIAENRSLSPEFAIFADRLVEPMLGLPINLSDPKHSQILNRLSNRPEIKKLEQTRDIETPKLAQTMIDNSVDETLPLLGQFSEEFRKSALANIPQSNISFIAAKTNRQKIDEMGKRNEQVIETIASALDFGTSLLLVCGQSREAEVAATVGMSLLNVAAATNKVVVAYAGTAATALAAGAATFGLGAAVIGAFVAIKSLFAKKGGDRVMEELKSLRNETRRQFHQVHKHLDQIAGHMDKRFDQMVKTQFAMIRLVASGFSSLANGQLELDAKVSDLLLRSAAMQTELRGLYFQNLGLAQSNVNAEFSSAYRSCVQSTDLEISQSEFKSSLSTFVKLSTDYASSETFLSSAQPDVSEDWTSPAFMSRELNRTRSAEPDSFWRNLRIIASIEDGRANLANLSHPTQWLKGASAFYECTSLRPEYASSVSLRDYENLILAGENTQQRIEDFKFQILQNLTQAFSNETDNLLDQMRSAYTEAFQKLTPVANSNDLPNLSLKVNLAKGNKDKAAVKVAADLQDFPIDLLESAKEKLVKTLGDIEALDLGTISVSANLTLHPSVTRLEVDEYTADNKVMDNDFLTRWNEIRRSDAAFYFLPEKYTGGPLNGTWRGYGMSKESILDSYPQVEWSKTYLPASLEFTVRVLVNGKSTEVSRRKNDFEILVNAAPVRRTFDFDKLMARVKKAYENPALYDGKNHGRKLSKKDQGVASAEAIKFIQDSVEKNQWSKTHKSHLAEGGFKKGPFSLDRLNLEISKPRDFIKETFEVAAVQNSWLKKIKLSDELVASIRKEQISRNQLAIVAATYTPQISSQTQLRLRQTYERLDGYRTAIQAFLKTSLSSSILNNYLISAYAFDGAHLGLWGHAEWIQQIQNLASRSELQAPDFKSLMEKSQKQIKLFQNYFNSRQNIVNRQKRIFSERAAAMDPLLARLCIGYKQMIEQKSVSSLSMEVQNICRAF
ncbi:MAG: hypothetical protein J0L93_04365 [Deltaproteobacteria bacterium]|nr:hypothetical protein [Deltaproteobacteria bacterium]